MGQEAGVRAVNGMDDREAAEACYHQMYKGMVEKDERILREVLAPDFVLVHMTGMRQPLEAFIQAVQNGTLNYSSACHQEIAVQLDGDRGKLMGQSLVHAAVFGGGWHTWRLQLACRLAKQNGKWRIIEARASTYKEEKQSWKNQKYNLQKGSRRGARREQLSAPGTYRKFGEEAE